MFHGVTLSSSVPQAPSDPVEFGAISTLESWRAPTTPQTLRRPPQCRQLVQGSFPGTLPLGSNRSSVTVSSYISFRLACPENIIPGQFSLANLSLALMTLALTLTSHERKTLSGALEKYTVGNGTSRQTHSTYTVQSCYFHSNEYVCSCFLIYYLHYQLPLLFGPPRPLAVIYN